MSDKKEGYTCDGSIKGIKGIGKPKNCMECWFSDWRGQETHEGKTRVMIHCDVKNRYKDKGKREPYVFNAETHEPEFPEWCPVEWGGIKCVRFCLGAEQKMASGIMDGM